MFDRENWNPKKFSWIYAGSIALLIILMAFLLINFQIVEIINLRVMYIPIVFLGILKFIHDFERHYDKHIRFRVALVSCLRTGVYTCLLLFPVILIVLSIGLPELGMGQQSGRFDEAKFQTGVLISMLIEILASVFISSFVAAFVPGMLQKEEQ